MIALLMFAAVSMPPGPGLRLGPPLADRLPQILVLDHDGNVASRITCIRNKWVNPDDSAARLLASAEVAAIVLALDGRLTDVEQLGPSKFECVILPRGPDR